MNEGSDNISEGSESEHNDDAYESKIMSHSLNDKIPLFESGSCLDPDCNGTLQRSEVASAVSKNGRMYRTKLPPLLFTIDGIYPVLCFRSQCDSCSRVVEFDGNSYNVLIL